MEFNVAAWRGWTSSAAGIDEIPAPLDVSFAPAMMRRRMSRLSKLMLSVAHGLHSDMTELPCVFASRHGELRRTASLLRGIAEGELMSPTAFSLSVHNSSVGLRSLVYANRAASTAIAAGDGTLAMAFIEALGELTESPSGVLLVYADERVPEEYEQLIGSDVGERALAVLLRPAYPSAEEITLSLSAKSELPVGDLAEQHAHLCHLLAGRASHAMLGGERSVWQVSRNDGAA